MRKQIHDLLATGHCMPCQEIAKCLGKTPFDLRLELENMVTEKELDRVPDRNGRALYVVHQEFTGGAA